MRGVTAWSYTPYRHLMCCTEDISICRVVPGENSIEICWLPQAGEFTVKYRKSGDEDFLTAGTVSGTGFTVIGLETGILYEFMVVSASGKSRIRSARTGTVAGTVVNYLAPEDNAYAFSGRFLCSPSLLKHRDGYLLASMDVYEHEAPQNLTLIFRSDDGGVSWRYMCELYPCFWGKLFEHDGKIFMLGCNTEYGDLLLGCSDNGGRSFTVPVTLLRGTAGNSHSRRMGIHKNPQPVVGYNGRLWITLEWGSWGLNAHAAMVGSVASDSDIMNPANWAFSEPLAYDPSWKGCAGSKSRGTIEGTLAVCPDGGLYNFMRYDMLMCEPNYGKILKYKVNTSDPEAPLTFDSAVPFSGNHSKFMIKYDSQSGYYYSVIDRIRDASCANNRNLLTLVRSENTDVWENVTDLIDRTASDPRRTGFQYVDFIFDGDDIIWLCRTADNGAESFHNSNYITFHRLKGFREIKGNIKT